jgi:hypothetical protein
MASNSVSLEYTDVLIVGAGPTEPCRDCRRPKTLRQYPYEKQTIQGRS